MHMKTVAGYLLIIAAIYAIAEVVAGFSACGIEDYMCVFTGLLKFCALVFALYIASKIL